MRDFFLIPLLIFVLFSACRKDHYYLSKKIVVHPTNFNQFLYIDAINLELDSLKLSIMNQYAYTVTDTSFAITNKHFEQYKIDLDINPGIYFCQITTLDTNFTIKVLKTE
jgi:hypothetical protein